MSGNHKRKLKVCKITLIFIFYIGIAGMFSITTKACEKDFDDVIVLKNNKNKGLLLTHDSMEESLPCVVSHITPWFFSIKPLASSENSIDEKNPLLITINTKPFLKKTKLPPDIILNIASFLSYSDQLKLSHINTEFRSNINEEFWKKQIIKARYLLWDSSIPNAKIFFANYFYQKGFGRHPKLREKIVTKMENITSLPNQLLAEKALNLGFPKGKENYRQVEHKKDMLKIALNNKEKYRFEEPTLLWPQSSLLWFFNGEVFKKLCQKLN